MKKPDPQPARGRDLAPLLSGSLGGGPSASEITAAPSPQSLGNPVRPSLAPAKSDPLTGKRMPL